MARGRGGEGRAGLGVSGVGRRRRDAPRMVAETARVTRRDARRWQRRPASPPGAEVPITLAGGHYREDGIPCRWVGPDIDVPMSSAFLDPLPVTSPDHLSGRQQSASSPSLLLQRHFPNPETHGGVSCRGTVARKPRECDPWNLLGRCGVRAVSGVEHDRCRTRWLEPKRWYRRSRIYLRRRLVIQVSFAALLMRRGIRVPPAIPDSVGACPDRSRRRLSRAAAVVGGRPRQPSPAAASTRSCRG
jgi:hypothetical protein